VHILDIPFTQAIRSVSRWGSGAKDLVAAMRKQVIGLAAGETSRRGPVSRSTIWAQGGRNDYDVDGRRAGRPRTHLHGTPVSRSGQGKVRGGRGRKRFTSGLAAAVRQRAASERTRDEGACHFGLPEGHEGRPRDRRALWGRGPVEGRVRG